LNKDSKIYVAGHTGLVGSAIVRKLKAEGYTNLIFRTHQELDLLDQAAVREFFANEKPEYVFLAAAKVGGILANNTYRAQFIYENLMIQNNIIHNAHVYGAKKLLFLGSSCIYPRDCPQPIKEEYLLTGMLEETNEPYAIAKIAGIKMCENYYRQYGSNFVSVMPTNLYGPNDNFDLETSHVLPAIIRKMHLAKCLEDNNFESIRQDLNKRPIENINGDASDEKIMSILKKYGISLIQHSASTIQHSSKVILTLWGTGKPKREFLYVDDMADACVYIIENVDAETILSIGTPYVNIGSGQDLSIKKLAISIGEVVGFKGKIMFDKTKPDGTPRKLLDISRLKRMSWQSSTSLYEGIGQTYKWYVDNTY